MMKRKTLTKLALIPATLLITLASTNAGEMRGVYELAESGTQIVFDATTGDNPPPQSQPVNATDQKALDLKPDPIDEFELVESGQAISFKSDSEESWPNHGALTEYRQKSHNNPLSQMIEFELVESGQTVMFEQEPESAPLTARGNRQCGDTNATC